MARKTPPDQKPANTPVSDEDRLRFQAEIFDRMSQGESLRSICRTPGFPSVALVLKWTHTDPVWREQYARGRDAQADALFDQLEEVANAALQAESPVEVAARRLIVDTQKWRLSKIIPNRYGEKLALTGNDGGPIQTESKLNVSGLTPEQLRAIAAIPLDAS